MPETTLTGGNDTFVGGNGDQDTVYGLGGEDLIDGNNQADVLIGGEGADTLIGSSQSDFLYGGNYDFATGEVTDDFTRDFLVAGNSSDTVYAGQGDVAIAGNGQGVIFLPEGYTDSGDDSVITYPTDATGGTASASFNVFTSTVPGSQPIYVNGFGSSDTYTPLPCFASGTLVATARGEVAVEDLRVGDLVLTAHGGAALQPIVWIGHSRVNVARQPNRAAVAPILIKAGALAEGVPHRDLRVSPEHAMFLDGHLVPAKHLVNGATIVQEMWCPEVTYWHVELPAHGLLVAEGAVSESYFDDGNRKNFDNHGISTLFKDFASDRANGKYAEAACYPLLQEGALLERIRLRLNGRVMTLESAERRSA